MAGSDGYTTTIVSMDPLAAHGMRCRYGVVRLAGRNKGTVLLDILVPRRDALRFVRLAKNKVDWSLIFPIGNSDHVMLEFMGQDDNMRVIEDAAKGRGYQLLPDYDRDQAPPTARLLHPPSR